MNHVAFIGRLANEPKIIYTKEGTSVAKFSIAVSRKFKREGQPDADFFNVTTFRATAEFIEKYFHKGDPIALTGSLQTGSYENKDGQKVYTIDVLTDNVEFTPSKPGESMQPDKKETKRNEGFIDVPDDVEGEALPFN